MEKCVRILIEYLENKSNWYLQFVLALQWCKLLRTDTTKQLKLYQKQQLFTVILTNFIRSATNHVKQFNRTTAKAKTFLDFYINVYELYENCTVIIQSEHYAAYSKLMIECYRLCCAEQDDFTLNMDGERASSISSSSSSSSTATNSQQVSSSVVAFQQALNFCTTELNNRALAQKKPSTTKVNKPDNNPSTTNNLKKRRPSEAKSNQIA